VTLVVVGCGGFFFWIFPKVAPPWARCRRRLPQVVHALFVLACLLRFSFAVGASGITGKHPVTFLINVTINSARDITGVFAGDLLAGLAGLVIVAPNTASSNSLPGVPCLPIY